MLFSKTHISTLLLTTVTLTHAAEPCGWISSDDESSLDYLPPGFSACPLKDIIISPRPNTTARVTDAIPAGDPFELTTVPALVSEYPKCAQTCAEDFFTAYLNRCDRLVNVTKNQEAGWSCVCTHAMGVQTSDEYWYDRYLQRCIQDECDEGRAAQEEVDMQKSRKVRAMFWETCQGYGIVENITVAYIGIPGITDAGASVRVTKGVFWAMAVGLVAAFVGLI